MQKYLVQLQLEKIPKLVAGSVVLKEVPPNSTVVGIPGRVVIQDGKRINKDLNHCDLPDPVADRFKEMQDELDQLKART